MMGWAVSTTVDGKEILVEVPDDEADNVMVMFRINPHAWRYFGVMCFDDRPGYFPQLEAHRAGLPSIR